MKRLASHTALSRLVFWWSLSSLAIVPAAAQSRFIAGGGVQVAASGPSVEAAVGYSYVYLDTPSRQRVGLSGVDSSAVIDFGSRWGLTMDSSYARTSNVLGTGHGGNVLTCLTGPVFYPWERGRTRIFIYTLAGVSLVNSAIPVIGTYYLGGTVTRFSYATGGGMERKIDRRFSIRIGVDYLRTTFANSSAEMKFQNNIRVISGISFRFGNR